ncbi:MAG: hypothetical protein HC888_00460 [Candidatus Competibacteraceae bacterium]|nr:hypothetical protein [Candidatus Competibacteraceae bacterium]
MFDQQAVRLLREKWANTNLLAEELYAIFRSTKPVEHTGNITVNQPPGEETPPLRVNLDPGSTGRGIVVNQGDSSVEITGGGIIINGDNLTTIIQEAAAGAGGGVVIPQPPDELGEADYLPFEAVGRIVSGKGSTYLVEVWLDDPTGPSSGTVEATQLQIASDQVIPEGTWCKVTVYPYSVEVGLVLGRYYIQVPVWL